MTTACIRPLCRARTMSPSSSAIRKSGVRSSERATSSPTIKKRREGKPKMWQPNERYPDPAVRVLDPSFNKYRLPLASVERLYTGCRWSEGPVYFGDGRYLLWSDIPNNRILRWDEETGNVSVFRKPSNNANGHTRDRQGRLVACEHDARRVVRTEYDGVDHRAGRPLQRQAAELAQRRGGEVRRLDLVHRSDLRHPGLLRGPQGREREHAGRLSRRRQDRQAHHDGRRRRRAPTASPSRPTRRSSMSWPRAPSRPHDRRLRRASTTAPSSATARC